MVRILLAAVAAATIRASPTDVGAPLAHDSLAQDAARILDDDVASAPRVSVPGVVDIDKQLERCSAEGYSNLNAYMTSDDSTVDHELLRHCNDVKYRDALRTSVAAPHPSPRHVHFWRATNETTYQDVFEKHILASHPIRLAETLALPPALVTSCFGSRAALQTPDATCIEALTLFRVPQCIVNDYMQRVESIKETLLPEMVATTDAPLHCPFGLHMVVAAVTDATTVSLQVHVPSYDEYTFVLDVSTADETEMLEARMDAQGIVDAGADVVRLLRGEMAFIPSGFAVAASAPVLRFCFADASNLNRVKQHLRVSGLVDATARRLLLALQAPTFDTSMMRRPSPSLATWAMYRTWPKPERIAKESDQAKQEAVSRKDRYKMWQDDRKWDSVIQGLTLPVSRPPVVIQDSDMGRTVVHLTWQDLHQPRKGDVTPYGYEVHWASDAIASNGIANLTHTDLLRSALPTTAFGGDFDGRAITGLVSNLAANTSYTFAVRLFVGNALGLLSERSQNIRTKPASVPAPVPGLPDAAASDAANCVQLTWLPVVDDGGRPILGYAIAARHAPTTNASLPLSWRPFNDSIQYDVVTNDALLVTKHELSLNVKNMTGHLCNLRAASRYQFQVAAINELGASGFSIWSNTIEVEPSSHHDRREVVRGQGAPHFTRTYDRAALQIGATAPSTPPVPTGPVLVFSDVLQTVAPYQLVGLANPVRKLDANNKVLWSTWRADVWSGQHSLKAYDIIAEAVLADPILGDTPLTNGDAVRDRILLVHRGVVPLYTKVAHAQAAGALGVLILDVENQCALGFDQHCSPGSHYASGDGVGAKDDPLVWTSNIRIPYALVKYDDALPLLEKIAAMHSTDVI